MAEKGVIRIGRLDTVGRIATMQGRIFRMGARGHIEMSKATQLTTILREIRCSLEAKDMEARIEALEALSQAAPAEVVRLASA